MGRPDAGRRGGPGPAPARPGFRDRHLTTLLALIGVVILLYGLDAGTTAGQVIVTWLLMAVLNLYFAVMFWRLARLRSYGCSARRLWWSACFAGGAYLLGDLVQLVVAAADPLAAGSIMGTGVQSALVMLGTSAMIVGMLAARPDTASRGERTRMRLDVATVMAAATTFGLYAFEAPAGAHTAGWFFDLVATLLVAPGVFLIAIYAVVKLVLSEHPPFTRAAGITCGVACMLQGTLQSVPLVEYTAGGLLPVLLGGNVVVSAMIAVGARLQWRGQPGRRQATGRRRRPYSVLPYAAIAATNALLVYALADEGLDGRAWLVIGGSLLSTSLVVGRQLAAFQHIAELLAERDGLTARLTELAFHDDLTGLANRALFMRRLSEALAGEGAPATLAVVLVDLDDFKPVNDRFGHAAGDELLRRVGRWLTEAVRDGDTVARLGGDEFAVLIDLSTGGDRTGFDKRLAAALHRRTRIAGAEIAVRGSVGVAVTGPGRCNADDLLHEADLDMYAAKRRSKDLAASSG